MTSQLDSSKSTLMPDSAKSSLRVFVTGHRGYIGSALFRAMSKFSLINELEGYDIIDGDDILDLSSLVSRMKSFQPHVVVHLAALSSVTACNENWKKSVSYNAVGTRNVLTAMNDCGCRNIIYASTSSIYGDTSKVPYTEDSVVDPCSPYGLSKLLGEQVIYNYYNSRNNPGNFLIYRMFNVVGTSGYPDIDNVSNPGYDRLFAALESGHLTIYGNDYPTYDGTCQRDYVSLKDVCSAFLKGIKVVKSNRETREIINICTGRPCSVQTIVNTWNSISKHLLSATELQHKCSASLPEVSISVGCRRDGDPANVYGLNTKASRVLNWNPTRKIENIICDLAHDKKI